MIKPMYLKLLENGELKDRVKILKNKLKHCELCPHRCKVNRLNGEKGYCKTLENVVVASFSPHFGEEPELVGQYGSGTIFFSHCNLECVFCQNYDISYCGEGEEISIEDLSNIMLYLQRKGCHNINLVSPGHIIPQIVEAIFLASQNGLNIPIVYNSNGYDLVETLKLLDGIIDIYMPDIKFGNDDIAFKYLGVKNYYKYAKDAIKEMYRQVNDLKTYNNNIAYKGILIRHLVMPQNIADTEKIINFIAEELSKDTYVNIMSQYYPTHKAFKYKEINRRINNNEYITALNAAKKAGLRRFNIQ